MNSLSLPSEKQERRVGQPVKTPPFHGGITGSIPVHGTKKSLQKCRDFYFDSDGSEITYPLQLL
jgi:hypothetical protein